MKRLPSVQVDSGRPEPPPSLHKPGSQFTPAPELEQWLRRCFIAEDGPLYNPEHRHLKFASIRCLWTNVPNKRRMNAVVGQAEMPMSKSGWGGARSLYQLEQWFGAKHDFVLTFYAPYAATVADLGFCALAEHELYHCAQALNAFGAPSFRKSGLPALAIRGHDVEEFVGVVRRYGAGAAAGQTRALVAAGQSEPAIGAAQVAGCCGTCRTQFNSKCNTRVK